MFRVFALIILSHALYAQPSNDEFEIHQAVTKVFDALSNRDAEGLRKLCTSDVRFYEYGEIWPVDTLIHRAITKNIAADFKRINKIDFVSTTIADKTAWTTYNLHSDITRDGKSISIKWMETVIVVREEEKWKIKVLHSTRISK